MYIKKIVVFIILTTLVSCVDHAVETDIYNVESLKLEIRTQAELFLQAARDEEWEKMAGLVYINENAKAKLHSESCLDLNSLTDCLARNFARIYLNNKPGNVFDVRIDDYQANTALVTYRHGDMDRLIFYKDKDRWWYLIK